MEADYIAEDIVLVVDPLEVEKEAGCIVLGVDLMVVVVLVVG